MVKKWGVIKNNENIDVETKPIEKVPINNLSKQADPVICKSMMELIILVMENSKNKEEAIEAIRNLSIMKSDNTN